MNIPKGLRAVFMVVLAVAAAFIATACAAQEQPENTEPSYDNYHTDQEETTEETLPPVQLEMPEYELTYSGELQDVMVVKQLEDQNALEFSVKLSAGEVHIFTLKYNTNEGELVTVLVDAAGNRIPVAFEMAPLPENLSEEDQLTFFAAQESVNEIVDSLVLK